MAALGLLVGTLGVGDPAQVADDLAQPGRIQPPGRLHQHRLSLGGELVGELLGACSQDGGVSDRQLPVGQRLGRLGQGATEQGPGRPDRAVGGPGAHPQPGPEPAGGRADLDPVLGPGGAAGIHGGQLGQPVAFQPVHQPPQPQDPFGPDRVRQAVQVLGGQPLDGRGQGH